MHYTGLFTIQYLTCTAKYRQFSVGDQSSESCRGVPLIFTYRLRVGELKRGEMETVDFVMRHIFVTEGYHSA